ncbi:MAG: hypothetical protein C0518_08215 [Opitutus sp.]|nr:hypothetical protein [Opitutus sp.]
MSNTAHPPINPAVVEAARRRHATALRSYAVELCHGNRGLGQTAVDETWTALEKTTEPESDGRMVEWLFTDVRRRAVAAQRGAGLAQQFDASAEDDDGPETADGLFARLTPKQQEVLRLKFVQGFRHEEIARIVELSGAHAAQLLHNALRRLARAFRAAGDSGDASWADDFRLTLAALGELDGGAWQAWEAGQIDVAAANARMEEIRRAGKWAATHIARGGGRATRKRGRKNPRGRGWWIGLVAVAGVIFGTLLVEQRNAAQSTERRKVVVDERGGRARVAVRHAPEESASQSRPAADDAVTLGVFRPAGSQSRPPSTKPWTASDRVVRAATGAAASANVPEIEGTPATREPVAQPTGASDARRISGPRAVKEGAEEASHVTEPAAERARESEFRGGPGRSARPVAERTDQRVTNERTTAEVVASTDTAAIVALKRALGEGRWPRAQEASAERWRNYFAVTPARRDRPLRLAKDFEAARAPWAPGTILVRATVTAPDASLVTRAPANVILLLDVSGSMDAPNRLPLVQEAVRGLLDRLQAHDRVGLVTYAGESRVLLGPTPVTDARRVREAVQSLEARGRTNGGAGLAEALALARGEGSAHGAPVVIWCTDGEFNVGPSSETELAELVRGEVSGGVRLAIFGFGRNGQIDPRLEKLALLAGGGSGYVNTRSEAIAVLLGQLDGLISPVADDARLVVTRENEPERQAAEDKLWPGQSIAVLATFDAPGEARARLSFRNGSGGERRSESFEWDGAVKAFAAASPEFRFAAAVERFTNLLAGPPEAVSAAEWDALAAWAGGAVDDAGGYRAEFLALVEQARVARGQGPDR